MIPKEALLGKLEPLWVPLIIVLVALGAFGLGRLSAEAGEKGQLRVLYPEAQAATPVANTAAVANAAPARAQAGQGSYVASKSGSKYYLTTCSGASRIKDENKVYFASAGEAAAAGYGPAANCPGL